MGFLQRNIKKVLQAAGGVVGGAVAGIGSAIPIGLIGGPILTGIGPIVAAVALGVFLWHAVGDLTSDVSVLLIEQTVEVIG